MKASTFMTQTMKATGLRMQGYSSMWLLIKQSLYKLEISPTIISQNSKVLSTEKLV